MFSHIRSLALSALIGLVAVPAVADVRVASWNIRNLGWNNGKDFTALAEVGRYFDLISVQEVMSQEGIDRFESALEKRTGVAWEQMCSHLIGRGSYKEMYCFVWRPDQLEWTGSAAVYIDDRDVFAREPFSSSFRTNFGFEFLATSVHSIYGDTVQQREQEALALRGYHDWLRESFPGLPVLLMGDFNLPPTNPAWAPMGDIAYPLIQEGGTTLSTHDGRFANLYDNIWVDAGVELPISGFGRVEFPHKILGITHEQARDSVSDHIPVYVEFSESASRIFARNDFAGAKNGVMPPVASFGAKPQNVIQVSETGVIGNRNSNIYHLPGCPNYSKVSQANMVIFSSEAEARAAGYRKAGNC